jgi:hypothetical protein
MILEFGFWIAVSRSNPASSLQSKSKIKSPKLLNRPRPAAAIADLDRPFHRHHENFAVTDVALVARAADLFQAIDGPLDEVVIDGNLEGYFAQQARLVFGAAVGFVLAALAGEAHRVAYSQPRHADPPQRFLHGLDFGRLNDGDDHFHGVGTVRKWRLRLGLSIADGPWAARERLAPR